MTNIKESWREACNAYLRAFCEKHGFDYEDAYWVGDDPGTTAVVCGGDYFVGINEMRSDIDLDAPESAFLSWYDYSLAVMSVEMQWHDLENFKEFVHINFESWIKGAPLPYTEKELEQLEECARRIREAQDTFIQKCRDKA